MLKELFDRIKEYISVIALVPLMLGGLWQVISLSIISPSYVRFFSVSQQIADGLLLAPVLFFSYIMYLVFRSISNFVHKSLSNGSISPIKIQIITLLSFLPLFGIISHDFYVHGLDGQISLLHLFKWIIIAFVALLSSVVNAHLNLHVTASKDLTETSKKLHDFSLVTTKIAVIVFLVFITIQLLEFTIRIGISYGLPENNINSEHLISKYKIDNKLTKKDSVKVLYLNDKYVFIKNKGFVAWLLPGRS